MDWNWTTMSGLALTCVCPERIDSSNLLLQITKTISDVKLTVDNSI